MDSEGISPFIRQLKSSSRFRDHVVHHERLPGSRGDYAQTAEPWPQQIRELLKKLGIESLYSHQVRAADAVRRGEHTVIATPTSSGKTLVYLLPVLERFLQGAGSTALYISPLKALARDQQKALNNLLTHLEPENRPASAVYDGDTPSRERTRIRKKPPEMLLSNPEMLHLGILPQHGAWSGFLSRLQHVIIDEVHTYRGIMGSNMAWVFRRLQRICSHYGANPTFIFCSATVSNPAELAEELTGLSVRAITESGAPQGPKHFLFLNPLLAGAPATSLQLLQAALVRELRTIVYCQSRKMTELISVWTQQRLANYAPYITSYRSGFLPEERRDIEAKLARGELMAVISTSALELGIDIGELDLCILVGYPGSVMATWQRGGRVGRQQQESAVILVGQEDSLDQYFLSNPEAFFRMEPERAVINPRNPVLSRSHLQCAAADLPLSREEPLLAEEESNYQRAEELVSQGLLIPDRQGRFLFPRDPRVQQGVPLRGSDMQLQIMELGKRRAIGSIDRYRACRETHPGAVYLHRGRTYVIEDIDFQEGTVLARQRKVNYFTRVRTDKQTEILDTSSRKSLGDVDIFLGDLRVTERFTGYEKRLTKGKKLISVLPLDLPPQIFETQGLWISLPSRIQERVERDRHHFMGGIHALEHLLIGIMPLIILTDRNDLGGISHPLHPQLESPAVFVFDAHPGGVGLASRAFAEPERLLRQADKALDSCGCSHGCPFCIQSPKCGSGNRPLDKRAARTVLQAILEGGEAVQRQVPEQVNPSPPEEVSGKESESAPSPRNGQLRYGVLDLETIYSAQEVGGWFNAHLMGMSVAVLYDSATDEYSAYWQSQARELLEALWSLDLVVGFNLLGFDYKVLAAYGDLDPADLPTLDILREVQSRLGHRLSLEQLVRTTLGASKSGKGTDALDWWRKGETDKLVKYCREDVRLTHALYLFGRQEGYLAYTNKAGSTVTVPVDWP